MLNNAKQILVSELVLAEHSSQDEVERLIENKINTSFNLFGLNLFCNNSIFSSLNKYSIKFLYYLPYNYDIILIVMKRMI